MGGGARDLASSCRAEGAGAGWPALEATEPPESRRMRIGRGDYGPPADDGNAFGRGVTAQTLGADLIRAVGLFAFVFEIADQAAPPDAEQQNLRVA